VGRLFSLTYPTAAVLLAIRSGHRYGFDIMDATGLPDGTVYPILRRLERRGVLAGAQVGVARKTVASGPS
jgi:DNA-binding PadR family transcriptional regulator